MQYDVVIVLPGGKEETIARTEDRREADLAVERHARSLQPGYAEVREAKD